MFHWFFPDPFIVQTLDGARQPKIEQRLRQQRFRALHRLQLRKIVQLPIFYFLEGFLYE
jgi:hypothetical protein